MQNIFTKNRIKIVIVLLLTFVSVKTISPNVFLADSPRINPLFIAKILNTPRNIAAMPGKFLSSLSTFKLFNVDFSNNTTSGNMTSLSDQNRTAQARFISPPAGLIFKSISKNVSAAEDPDSGNKYIKVEAGTKYKIIGYITLDGVQYPKIEFIE